MWALDDADTVLLADGQVAVATLKEHSNFSYKGTPNDDVSTWTFVLERAEDGPCGWKAVRGHRSTGVAPDKATPKTWTTAGK